MKAFYFICTVLISLSTLGAFSSVKPSSNVKLNDVLIVLDNSGSMVPYMENASSQLTTLITELNQERMHIGIVMSDLDTSDSTGSPFMGSHSRGDFSEVMNVLKRDINRLITGNGTYNEVFYEAVLRTMPDTTVPAFHREDTKLVVYIVTDEDQASDDMDSLDFLNNLKIHKKISDVVIHLITPRKGCGYNNVEIKDKNLYKVVSFTGGSAYDLCNEELVRIDL